MEPPKSDFYQEPDFKRLNSIPQKVDSSELAIKIYNEFKDSYADRTRYKIDNALAQNKKIVLVYQMGKVASSSYASNLEKCSDLEIFHVHRLSEQANNKMIDSFLAKGNLVLAFLELSWKTIYSHLLTKNIDIYILSAMRDPISRNISAYFQNLDLSKTDSVDKLIQNFFSKYPHNIPIEWFGQQFGETLNIDIFKYPFNRERGWDSFKESQYNCLFITAEISDDLKLSAINSTLNTNLDRIERENVAAQKPYAELYSQFKKQINIPEEYVINLLESKVAKHFYSDEMLDKFRNKWV